MERYAPNAKDLASRDVVARSMFTEIREGRGCGENGDHVMLKLDHLGAEVLNSRLPGIQELAKTFAHTDPTKEPIPVVPTCHYMMGGIPTNIHGQAITQDAEGNDQVIEGLYACGEIACVSVHGANRLGGNSLLDLVVFGRAAGLYLEKALGEGIQMDEAVESDIEAAMARLNKIESNPNGEKAPEVRADLQKTMQDCFGIFRTGEDMERGKKELATLQERVENIGLADSSKVFNTARIEALEVQNLFETAMATAYPAAIRTESRGAHSREDFPDRDDENWLTHSMYWEEGNRVGRREVHLTPNTVDTLVPKARTY